MRKWNVVRKQHNHSAVIDPLVVERMLRENYTVAEIANYYKVDRSGFYKRLNRDPNLRAAVNRGKQAKAKPLFGSAEIKTNTADVILLNLYDMLNDVKLMKGKVAA